jgi:hypothetical protein
VDRPRAPFAPDSLHRFATGKRHASCARCLPNAGDGRSQKERTKMNIWPSKKTMASALGLLVALSGAKAHASGSNKIHFPLFANPGFVKCLARFPDDPSRPPTADVTVTRGKLNDTLRLELHNIRPNLGFDLFTVERSAFNADGSSVGAPPNRGLAWYQSDIQTDANGNGSVKIKTILLDQIFGFDPIVALPPTHTFHVGFWFNSPDEVTNCVANPPAPTTPFNGEHNAGPLAMISLPDAQTGLGPLCTNPDFSTDPVTCNP